MEAKQDSEQPRWWTSRISSPETRDQAERIAGRLGSVAKELDLKSYYPKEHIAEIIEGATHLAVNHELKGEFFECPRRCMFLMGITEEWETTKDFGEKRKLLDVLSIVATEPQQRKTLSGKVTRLSGEGRERGTAFDPAVENVTSRYLEMVRREIEKDKDEEGSAHLETELTWSEKSMFTSVRRKLNLTEEKERPVRIVQLRLGSGATYDKYGYNSFAFTETTDGKVVRRTIVLPAHASTELTEHEYTHTQTADGAGVRSGFNLMLDRGLDEALTENAISAPQFYWHHRTVLKQINESAPGFENAAYRAYVSGEEDDLLKMDKLLIRAYGLQGRLLIARMIDIPNPRHYGRAGDVMINADCIKDKLSPLKRS